MSETLLQREVWGREEIVQAIKAWARKHGQPPRGVDWGEVTPEHPSRGHVTLTFGKWSDAIVAAGFPRPTRGNRTGWRDSLGANGTAPAVPLEALRASAIEPRILPMLWRRRVPAATLTVIAGKPGLGKSTLSTTIAAELSQRGLSVVVSNLEDDASAVIRPRLDVAGADLERVFVIPPSAAPVLPRDLPQLGALLQEVDARLLILDPIGAHFRPERLVHDRPTLRRLVQLARDTRCAIVAFHHTTKHSIDGTALGAIGGPSGGLAGTARAAYIYGFDPEDEDRRALACVKINGVDEPPALILEHETVDYRSSTGRMVEAGRIKIVEETNATGKKVLRPGRRRRNRDAECAEWLCLFLADGEDYKRQVQEIRTEGTAAGFNWATLRRAGTDLKIERERVGWGGDGFWLWRLPDSNPLREEAAA